jgi:hypothetical protein
VEVPPLGEQLFNALAAKPGSVAANLPEEFKKKFRENFEMGMAAFYESFHGDLMRFQRQLAHFIAGFSASPDSAYVTLFRRINPTRHIFCTLNYDLMIESAAARLGIHTTLYAYSAKHERGVLRLLKPHGSCNFWPKGLEIEGGMMINMIGPEIESPIRVLSHAETLRQCEDESNGLAPAIAMYAEGKSVRVSPHYISKQQQGWTAAVAAAAKVCIVGTKVNEADTHIWEPLARSPANIYYFGFDQLDRERFELWKDKSRKRNMYFTQASFSEAVPIIANHLERT